MIQSPAIWLGVVPVALLSLYHASAFLNANFGQHPLWKKHGLKAHRWLAANQVGGSVDLCTLHSRAPLAHRLREGCGGVHALVLNCLRHRKRFKRKGRSLLGCHSMRAAPPSGRGFHGTLLRWNILRTMARCAQVLRAGSGPCMSAPVRLPSPQCLPAFTLSKINSGLVLLCIKSR